MKYDFNILSNKETLIDSSNEDDLYNSQHTIKLNDSESLSFYIRDLKKLSEFEENCDKNLFQALLKMQPNFKKTEPLPLYYLYKNEYDLPVYILLIKNYFVFISLGEFQYGRYIMTLERIIEAIC